MSNKIFKNQWYPTLLITSLCIVLATQFLNIIGGKLILPLFHIITSLAVVVILVLRISDYYKLTIKLWSAIAVIGGSLGLVSTGLFVLIGRIEGNVELSKVVIHLAHFIIGFILFIYLDKSLNKQTS